MTLAQRSITSSAYNITANIVSLCVGLVGSILLARLVAPEDFGAFAFVNSVVQLASVFPNFGLQSAFLYRTGGENGVTEEILRVSFTFKALLSLVWVVLLAGGVALFAPAHTRWLFVGSIAIAFVGIQLNTINMLLTRQVQFRRLALTQATGAMMTTLVSVGLAWRGWGVWALLGGSIAATAVRFISLCVIRPVWRLRLGWSPELARYFTEFGGKVLGTNLLLEALDNVDDIWTGIVLGDEALGFYHKAYGFATYPRQVLTTPLVQVVIGAYAELLNQRARLSQTFVWVNLLMARANFWIAALMWLVAPEFIRLALGSQWLPMLTAFRLMLIYTMFDPIKNMISGLLIQSGAPERVSRARLIQLAVMAAGLVTLGPALGIAGVALAVDAMLIVGMVILYAEARRLVDFSLRQFFGVPTAALGLGLLAVYSALALPGSAGNDWLTGLLKGGVFSLVYAGVLLSLERAQSLSALSYVLKALRPSPPAHAD